jgi:hypothetical protein
VFSFSFSFAFSLSFSLSFSMSFSQGAFDPETGSVRYICRLHCGASLASAKGSI